MPETTSVHCQKCGQRIGKYTKKDDKVYILVGHALLKDAWGWCHRCGEEWYWHESDQQMDRLLERLREINSYQ